MFTQSELVDGIEAALFHDEKQGATLRTKNYPADPYQRSVITSRGRKSNVKVIVRLTTCVHGYFDSEDKIPASLIVLEYKFCNISTSGRIESIYTELEFSNETRKNLMDEPYVIAYAPFQEPGKNHRTEIEVEKKKAAMIKSLRVNAMGSGAELGVELGTVTNLKYTQEYFQLLQGSTEMSNQIGPGANVVWWNMNASMDPGTGEGVPPTLYVAALVKRKDNSKFKANFKLSVKAGAWQYLKDFWSFGKDDPILFDPTLEPVGEIGIDKNDLRKYTREFGSYRNLVNYDDRGDDQTTVTG